jgi:histidyl-tRNA synthetase
MVRVGPEAERFGFTVAERLRDALPGIKLQMHCGSGSFKSQFKKADKSGADYAVIIGGDEAARQQIGIKALRKEEAQIDLSIAEAENFFRAAVLLKA